MPKCLPSVFKHSQTNMQVPVSPATRQLLRLIDWPVLSEKKFKNLYQIQKIYMISCDIGMYQYLINNKYNLMIVKREKLMETT